MDALFSAAVIRWKWHGCHQVMSEVSPNATHPLIHPLDPSPGSIPWALLELLQAAHQLGLLLGQHAGEHSGPEQDLPRREHPSEKAAIPAGQGLGMASRELGMASREQGMASRE